MGEVNWSKGHITLRGVVELKKTCKKHGELASEHIQVRKRDRPLKDVLVCVLCVREHSANYYKRNVDVCRAVARTKRMQDSHKTKKLRDLKKEMFGD